MENFIFCAVLVKSFKVKLFGYVQTGNIRSFLYQVFIIQKVYTICNEAVICIRKSFTKMSFILLSITQAYFIHLE